MKSARNRVLIRPDKAPYETVNAQKVVKRDSGIYMPVMGKEYESDFSFQSAVVVAVPDVAEERVNDDDNGNPVIRKHDIILSPGDKVIVHHFLRDPHVQVNINGEVLTAMYYHKIFAIDKGDHLVCNCQFNFIEPMEVSKEETNAGGLITLAQKDTSKTYGRVRFMSESLKALGVNVGDLVGFMPQRNYTVKWNGQNYYRVETDDIICVLAGEEVLL